MRDEYAAVAAAAEGPRRPMDLFEHHAKTLGDPARIRQCQSEAASAQDHRDHRQDTEGEGEGEPGSVGV